MLRNKLYSFVLFLFSMCFSITAFAQSQKDLAETILNDHSLNQVNQMAADLLKTGFTAGNNYGEVWIRDFNTFMTLSCKVMPVDSIKKRLRVFFQMQGEDGNILDGYIPKSSATVGYDFIYSKNAPDYAGHKNTVETDQEPSLIQAVYKYIKATNDTAFLSEKIDGKSVHMRMSEALTFLMTRRYVPKYGLIYGATTADWGDVQPETPWGVAMDSSSHLTIDIYDNAMLLIALNNYIALFPAHRSGHSAANPESSHWKKVQSRIRKNIRKHLWNNKLKKFIPHIYLAGSPFPASFDENKIHYHGGTAVAIEAGLLNKKEIGAVNAQMLADVKAAGAQSIGINIYPPYPEGFFKNEIMRPYHYQNGGDWTWFGARMITQLVRFGFVQEAYEEIQPMVRRTLTDQAFYEWYTVDGKPAGSENYRGTAGVLYTAITALQDWAKEYNSSK